MTTGSKNMEGTSEGRMQQEQVWVGKGKEHLK
jgi:hypothetical protein